MKFLSSEQIDKQKWDAKVLQSDIENVFCYSWYLDAVCDHWGALVEDDYNTIVPIPYTNKLGVKQVIQPPFTRELDIFGKGFQWSDVLTELKSNFKSIVFRNSSDQIANNATERTHQYLDLENIKYSTNANRLIKKAQVYLYENGTHPKRLIDLFKGTAWTKIDSISEDDLNKLENLMSAGLKNGQGELIEVYDNGILIAAGYFLLDKKRVTYLKGASTDEGKKGGAMFGLMDVAIQKYKQSGYQTFDFGGSDVENVANFYKKFGASDRSYYNYSIENLPLWFKLLKKLKG
ncbi:MAG: GNAT family N-acetyltransferase [Crocinitomicaceae bacterium]|nr:GNAT family N-acetyltransferase [Crocinitomicaceae bacterium]